MRPPGLALFARTHPKVLAHGLDLRATHRELPLPPSKPSRPGAHRLGALRPQDTRKASVQSLARRAATTKRMASMTCLLGIGNGEKDGEEDLLAQGPPDI